MESIKNIKPYWIDPNLDWRSDLWQTYIDQYDKNWVSYIRTLICLFDNTKGKKNKLEIIIIMYAVILDSLTSCKKTIFYNTAVSQLDVFNEQTDFLYNEMFSDIKYELTKTIYHSFENYEYVNGQFRLTTV